MKKIFLIFCCIFYFFTPKISAKDIFLKNEEKNVIIKSVDNFFKNKSFYEIEKIKNSINSIDLSKLNEKEKFLINIFNEKFNKKNEKLICIDPGHQEKANLELEEIWPNSETKKAKVTDWAIWIFTKQKESELVLKIALKIEKLALEKNYKVFLTRNSQNVNLSNKQRSLFVNLLNCDAYVRLHADSSKNQEKNWISILKNSKENIFAYELFDKNFSLSENILSEIILETKAKNNWIVFRDDLTWTNFAKVPNTLIEMWFLSNKEEDILLFSEEYQYKLAFWILNWIEKYFINNL